MKSDFENVPTCKVLTTKAEAESSLLLLYCSGLTISNVVPVLVYKLHDISLQFSPTKKFKNGMADFCTAKNVGLQRVSDNLASTILTKCDPHWIAFIHPEQDRVLTVRKAARLKSFSYKTTIIGSVTQQYQQVGNAVPSLLSKQIGEKIVAKMNALNNS